MLWIDDPILVIIDPIDIPDPVKPPVDEDDTTVIPLPQPTEDDED